MVKWRDTMDTKGRERETDWELTQSGETPALIRVGNLAASCHCVGGGSDDGKCEFFGRGLTLIVGGRRPSPRATRGTSLSLKTRFTGIMGGRRVGFFDVVADKSVIAMR